MIDKALSRSKILQKIGAGWMGESDLAEDMNLHRPVALKFLPGVFEGEPDRLARLQRKAQRRPRHRVRALAH
jgi:serine/threonine protein kinase